MSLTLLYSSIRDSIIRYKFAESMKHMCACASKEAGGILLLFYLNDTLMLS